MKWFWFESVAGVHWLQRFVLAGFHEGNHQINTDSIEISKYVASPTRPSVVDILVYGADRKYVTGGFPHFFMAYWKLFLPLDFLLNSHLLFFVWNHSKNMDFAAFLSFVSFGSGCRVTMHLNNITCRVLVTCCHQPIMLLIDIDSTVNIMYWIDPPIP